MGIRGLGAVDLTVRELDPTAWVLTEVLGFRKVGEVVQKGGQIVTFEVGGGGPGATVRVIERPDAPWTHLGRGGVHHIAFRTPDDEEHAAWREKVRRSGLGVTPQIDRYYFRSIYFREPGGVLFEIATDGPGFATDEDVAHLGERLSLPPFLEDRREEIEAGLDPITVEGGTARSWTKARFRKRKPQSIASRDSDTYPDPQWLRWARRLQAIAQDGLTYTKDDYDFGRYEQLRELAAEILAAHSTGTLEEAGDLLALETGPATPKVDVRAAVFREDRILLVKETGEVGWSLPGGWADVGESPSEAAARETMEESGYRVRPVRLLAAYDRDRHGHPPIPYHVYKLVFLCEILDQTPSPDVDTDGVRFFGEHEIPGLSVTRIIPPQVSRFFQHRRNPSLPPDFD
jgi:ADP-ribose pyrophosphatase YjhB (NUDIX family)/catechol 2,3-dioxygenase-like lactoylglutathione lyase family enzyme